MAVRDRLESIENTRKDEGKARGGLLTLRAKISGAQADY